MGGIQYNYKVFFFFFGVYVCRNVNNDMVWLSYLYLVYIFHWVIAY